MADLIKIIRNCEFTRFGIRHLSDDENYNIGDIVRNSYDWNYELDHSTYEDEAPVELDGACAYELNIDSINDTDEEIQNKLNIALEESKCYSGDVVLLGSDWAGYGQDENEIIMQDAEVLYKF
nr:MAG TPA: hypothetical protein [Caudoviricetes sp.]